MAGPEQIRALVLDVDGVLTDGRLYYTAAGETAKIFHVRDGAAIKAWKARGFRVAFLSGRDSAMVARRADELGVDAVIQGRDDKLTALSDLLESWAIAAEQVCYVGDDLPDIPAMQACGFAVAVADAAPQVKDQADWITAAPGGAAAVREVVDHLLARVRL